MKTEIHRLRGVEAEDLKVQSDLSVDDFNHRSSKNSYGKHGWKDVSHFGYINLTCARLIELEFNRASVIKIQKYVDGAFKPREIRSDPTASSIDPAMCGLDILYVGCCWRWSVSGSQLLQLVLRKSHVLCKIEFFYKVPNTRHQLGKSLEPTTGLQVHAREKCAWKVGLQVLHTAWHAHHSVLVGCHAICSRTSVCNRAATVTREKASRRSERRVSQVCCVVTLRRHGNLMPVDS